MNLTDHIPSIGAVVITRNDGYGGRQLQKMAYGLTSLINLLDEVILVDWNSGLDGQPGLHPIIRELAPLLPKTNKLTSIVVGIQEAVELAGGSQRVQNCCEVLARNIGLRRLKSDYLISTNHDIMLFNREMIENGIIDDRTFHCIARRETPLDDLCQNGKWLAPGSVELADYLTYNYDKYGQHGTGSPLGPEDKWSLITCPGDCQLAHRQVWYGIRGFEENMVARGYTDSNVQRKAEYYGFGLELVRSIPALHFIHDPGTGSTGGNSPHWNDRAEALEDFAGSRNGEDWGFAGRDFKKRSHNYLDHAPEAS